MTAFTPSQDASLIDNTGEKRVWQAVIVQALMDASANGRRAEIQKAKREARSWLEDNSADFQLVCENAGLHPEYVRKIAAHARKNDYQWRTPPGQAENYIERGKNRYEKEREWERKRLERIRAATQLMETLSHTHTHQPQ